MNKSMRGVLIAVGALVVVLVVGLVGYRTLGADSSAAREVSVEAKEAPQESTAAPREAEDVSFLKDYDATVYDEAGQPVTLTSIAAGRPLVFNFWATWCPYCVREMPYFVEAAAQFGDRVSFAFVDATDGQRETVEGAAAWLDENGFGELPAYYDSEFEASRAFGVRSLPTTVFVSGEGEILLVRPGAMTPEQIQGAIDTMV